ncbi:MAG: class I SAM-dependent methyltransferase [Nitrosopumilus sp.]|uniref:class I SAM-dependent methyltransferase n=1 Tax=Nitrosopumilus sp. TaxID=2024843 RepID=UPI00247D2295|nr:class I SAM-dependent methyltransferase [Nitrosopumilus sp.]MCV0392434.1 class I SAM-dependent methyltransferase [Nitrosopumilus sp.]
MISINPLDVLLWTLRRNERDVVQLYSTLSPIMQLATGGNMLNFGLWDSEHREPQSAQKNLSYTFAKMADLDSANKVLDVGSGLSAPAIYWKNIFDNLFIFCVNTNYSQLYLSEKKQDIEFVNSSSTKLPFSTKSVDRVLALESAQHFKPFSKFISESKRVLVDDGLLVLAIPITINKPSSSKLGILKFTWSSEHYGLDEIRQMIHLGGFSILEEKLIGSSVYEPLTDYYVEHRKELKKLILKKYSSYVETILFKSLKKMKTASQKKIIDYALLKCQLPSNSD